MDNFLAKHSGWRKLKNLIHDRFQKWEGQEKVWKPDGIGIDGNNAAEGYLDVCHSSCCYGDTKTNGLCHLMMPGKKTTHKTQKMHFAIRYLTCMNWEDERYRLRSALETTNRCCTLTARPVISFFKTQNHWSCTSYIFVDVIWCDWAVEKSQLKF